MPANFADLPTSVIDNWPPPNYDDPVRRPWLPGFAMFCLAVSTVAVNSRFVLRARNYAGGFGLDDVFVFIGWVFSIGLSADAWITASSYGLDRHTWDVRPAHYVGAAKAGWWAQVLFHVSTCASKLSVLLFFRRMAKSSYSRRWKVAIWLALAFTGAVFVSILLGYCLICQPLAAYWLAYDPRYGESYRCVQGTVLSVFIGVLSVVSDLIAVFLPFVMLRHYHLDVARKKKIGLYVILALGLLVAGAGVVRTYYLWKIDHTYDTSWVGFDLFAWSLVECHLAMICASAASLRVIFRRFVGGRISRALLDRHSNETHRKISHPTLSTSSPRGTAVVESEKERSSIAVIREAAVLRPARLGEECIFESLEQARHLTRAHLWIHEHPRPNHWCGRAYHERM